MSIESKILEHLKKEQISPWFDLNAIPGVSAISFFEINESPETVSKTLRALVSEGKVKTRTGHEFSEEKGNYLFRDDQYPYFYLPKEKTSAEHAELPFYCTPPQSPITGRPMGLSNDGAEWICEDSGEKFMDETQLDASVKRLKAAKMTALDLAVEKMHTPAPNLARQIEMKAGDELFDVAAGEMHTILSIEPNGYITIQYSAMKHAGLDGGVNIIHESEVDGVHIKHYGK